MHLSAFRRRERENLIFPAHAPRLFLIASEVFAVSFTPRVKEREREGESLLFKIAGRDKKGEKEGGKEGQRNEGE